MTNQGQSLELQNVEKVIGLIAGGDDAIRKAVEQAEDDINLASKELIDLSVSKNDIVIGISASGATPYVLGGLSFCKKAGITCAALSCNPGSEIGRIADYCIEVVVGPQLNKQRNKYLKTSYRSFFMFSFHN